MRLSFLATALFSLSAIVASPAAPIEARHELDARDAAAAGELEARTWSWNKCKLTDKWACYKKGERFKWDKHACHCEEVGCPQWEKDRCNGKGEFFKYNEHECECECASHGKTDCEKKGKRFQWNEHKCECKDVGCSWKDRKSCKKEGGSFNEHECTCKHP